MIKAAKIQPENRKHSLLFSISNKVGGLAEVLDILKRDSLSLSRIESRPSKTERFDYDFFIDIDGATEGQVNKLVAELQTAGYGANTVQIQDNLLQQPASRETINKVPWFPRKISDLDLFANKTLEFGAELSSDHPGFTDSEYRKRRIYITEVARTYKYGYPIPTIEYTKEEIATWNTVYTNLTKLYPKYACKQHNYVFPLLQANCGFGPNNIPQLEDISRFLQECTGFRLRPVQGLLSSRDFLNGLAFRVFHATQYIRHHSKPLYTPEPDVCHELLGHVPLFADPDFADFSQEIGLASLGASDEDIEKLATCYWFTVEFGLCRENGELKAYGAGLLSSFGELEYSVGLDPERKPEVLEFDAHDAAARKYPITEYQPVYYAATSFQSAKEKLSQFASTLNRPFSVRYNPLTQSIEILDTKDKLTKFVKELQGGLSTLTSALGKLPNLD
jgi:phenylalanine-4-hydroxylase